jgi:REP element-mobilizing transposase RayT
MAHTLTNLLFHVIFGTKGRQPSIDPDVREPLHAYLGGIVRELNGIAIVVNGTDDHVHALIKTPATLAIADALRVMKTNSSKWVHETHGRSKFGWQSGYAAFTVSESGARAVRSYIEQQEKHHRKKSFEEEYIEFLVKNGISYDPRYVFE